MWPFKPKAPPRTVLQQALQSPTTRFNPSWAFTYVRKPGPSPGAQNYAFENLGLAEFSPIGPGIANRSRLPPFGPRPLFGQLAVPVSGIGGLSAGQMILQPLLDPATPVEDQFS